MLIEKKRAFIINCAFVACLVAIGYICFKYLLVWMLPFVIGLITAACLQPPINWLTKKTHLKKRLISPIVAFILVSAVALFSLWLGFGAVGEIGDVVARLPGWYQAAAPAVINAVNSSVDQLLASLPIEIQTQMASFTADIVSSTQSQLIAFSSNVLTWIANKASMLPSVLISIIITIVATFFMSVEFDNVKKFFSNQIPARYRAQITNSWNTFGKTVLKMLTSYLFIMFVTFVELALGLILLQVNYAVLLAAMISLVDILPVLGTGTVLIPWGLICLIMGQTRLGLGILLIYLTITIVRNILEPKIIGKRIGLHPLVTLIFMYLGLHIMGLLGMFLFPLAIILAKDLQDSGAIRLWRKGDEEMKGAEGTKGTDERTI